MLIANRIAASYIVMIGGIICSILFIVSFTTFLTKSKLRCSDYQKDEVKLKKEIVKDLEVLINYDDTETTSSTVMATSRSPTLE
ncbi:MAG: hypothetical protein ACTSSB_06200 [Candidatus Heimdallarchaeota archaeon]